MSETSRSQVTITLGRTGQVVKRGGGGRDGSLTDPHPVVGSKRSVRERLGNNVDSSIQFDTKRFRGDSRTSSSLDGVHLSKNDLRHKIMKKQRQTIRPDGGDLRNILSRPANSLTNSSVTRQRMPEPMNTRSSYRESLDAKQLQFIEPTDREHLIPMSRNSSQQMEDYRIQQKPNPREFQMHEERESRQRVDELEGIRRHVPEPNSSGVIMANVSGLRANNTMTKPESRVNPYAPWTLDQLRRRSPDKALVASRPDKALEASRGLSSATSNEELQGKFTVRVPDDANVSNMSSKDAFAFSRPVATSSFLTKSAPPVGSVGTTTAPLLRAPVPQPSSLAQRSSYVVDDNVNVDSLLKTLGLERYAILFKAEEVDMYSLKRMTENDLKEMGLPMGPRKKILLSLQPRLRMQAM